RVPPRFFLSPRAARGILRRAEKRGRELPHRLHQALESLATRQDEGEKTTSTSPSSMPVTTQTEPLSKRSNRAESREAQTELAAHPSLLPLFANPTGTT